MSSTKPYIARLRFLRMAPRKVKSVADLLKGLSVQEAEAQLIIQRRRVAKPLLKLLRSAVANVKNNRRQSTDHLFVESIRVDQGPMLKRMLPRARGMATPIQKKMSHVTLVLGEKATVQNRFQIISKKKDKHVSEEKGKAKKIASEHEHEGTLGGRQNPNFFKRMFSRKSGM